MSEVVRYLFGPRGTMALTGIAAGVYLFLTFANEDAWATMVNLLSQPGSFRVVAWVFVLQVFVSGTAKLVRGRLRGLPVGMLLVSLSILLLATLLSLAERQSSRVRVHGSESAGGDIRVLEVGVKFPPRVLSVGESLEFKLGRTIAVLDDTGRRVEVRPFPPAVTSRGLAYVDDAGMSTYFRFIQGSEVVEADKLDLLPPGTKAQVSLGDGYRAEISLAPAREFAKGRLTAREYDLAEPAYIVTLKRGTMVLGSARMADGEQMKLAGMNVSTGDTEGWVDLVFVRNSYALAAWAGVLGMLAGIALLPLWVAVRVTVRVRPDGPSRS